MSHSTKPIAPFPLTAAKVDLLSRSTRVFPILRVALILGLLALANACSLPGTSDGWDCPVIKEDGSETVSDQLACMYDVAQDPNTIFISERNALLPETPLSYIAAIKSLVQSGYLVEVEEGVVRKQLDTEVFGNDAPTMETPVTAYYPTADGMDYLYRHRHPVCHWLKTNWFPLVIAVVNAIIGSYAVLVPLRGRLGVRLPTWGRRRSEH